METEAAIQASHFTDQETEAQTGGNCLRPCREGSAELGLCRPFRVEAKQNIMAHEALVLSLVLACLALLGAQACSQLNKI